MTQQCLLVNLVCLEMFYQMLSIQPWIVSTLWRISSTPNSMLTIESWALSLASVSIQQVHGKIHHISTSTCPSFWPLSKLLSLPHLWSLALPLYILHPWGQSSCLSPTASALVKVLSTPCWTIRISQAPLSAVCNPYYTLWSRYYIYIYMHIYNIHTHI